MAAPGHHHRRARALVACTTTALALLLVLLLIVSAGPAGALAKGHKHRRPHGHGRGGGHGGGRGAGRGASLRDGAITRAQATWYTGIESGFCGFFGNLPSNRFIAAMPSDTTSTPPLGAGCGSCIAVFCRPGRVQDATGAINLDRSDTCASTTDGIVARVTDTCSCQYNANWCCGREPGTGKPTHVDLSREAFSALAKNSDAGIGIMAIDWAPVDCGYLGQRVTRQVVGGGAAPAPPVIPAPVPVPAPAPQPAPQPNKPAPKPPSQQTCASGSGSCSPDAFTSAAQALCPTPGLWAQAASTPLAGSRKQLGRLEQCGGAGASCCAYARPVANGKRVQAACYDRPFAGRSCEQGTTCQRKNQWYWQCL